MYSGTTFHNRSGNIVGAHQKIDRAAYKVLSKKTGMQHFPQKKHIIHFEGKNGPDGIKSKSPAQNEPWHFYDPFDTEDTQLLQVISEHMDELTDALKEGNEERSAFEASWLAHAIVDGLTPAHHFPYEAELAKLRKGAGNETRNNIREKLIMKGDTLGEKFRNNWKMWGIGGLMTSHGMFEFGLAVAIAPLSFKKVEIRNDDLKFIQDFGFEDYFDRNARTIAMWDLYERFIAQGWTTSLSRKVRDDLMPLVIQTVATAWYICLKRAGKTSRVSHANK